MNASMSRAMGAAVAVALTFSLAACGDDDGDDRAEADATTTSEAAGAETVETVDVTAVDYRYEGLPSSVEAGTRLTLQNDSTREVHELVAIRIPEDETRPVDELAALPPDELFAVFPGEPAAVLLAPPSEEAFAAVGDGTLTEPGRYLLFCAIPTGADPEVFLAELETSEGEPPDVPGGPPHFVGGMFAELEVH
ncbi:MAG: hypothetical protein ACRD0U_19615 [Acidimicrobiales bacterium]